MDQLDAITLLYLAKNWDGKGSLLEYAHKFQQTKDELHHLLQEEHSNALNQPLQDGSFTF